MYALFNNLEEFNYWHLQQKEIMGYPLQCYRGDGSAIPGSFVEDYTTPIVHPITESVIAPIDSRATHDNLLTLEQAVAMGYFTLPEEREE